MDYNAICYVNLQVIWKYFYKEQSEGEHGTLYQLKNLINYKNVPKNPKSNFNAVDDFLEIVITAYVIQGALHLLHMSSIDSEPDSAIIASPELLWTKTDEERKEVLMEVSKLFVAEYVDFSLNPPTPTNTSDYVYDYTRHFMSIGCFYLNFKDAIKEGDGERVLECWCYLLRVQKLWKKKLLL